MDRKPRISTRRLVLTALLAALTVGGSAIRITLPLEISGTTSFHLGNILCVLSGLLLGPWLGGLAAGMGSAIYDMLNPLFISEAPITFLLKGVYGLVAGLIAWAGHKRWSYEKATLAAAISALTYAALYLAKSYFYNGLFLGGLTPKAALLNLVGKLGPTAFNAAVAILFAPMLAVAIRKALERNHFQLNS